MVRKHVKYSWLSAKRNPQMINDYYIKTISSAKNSVSINKSRINDIELKIEVTDVVAETINVFTGVDVWRSRFNPKDFVKKDFIKFKVREISEYKDSDSGIYVGVYNGYDVLLNAINKQKNTVEAYNRSVKYLKELEEEHKKFKKRYL